MRHDFGAEEIFAVEVCEVDVRHFAQVEVANDQTPVELVLDLRRK